MKIIPIVVGSLGALPKQFGNRLKQIGITGRAAQIQKTVLLGTAREMFLKSKATGCGSISIVFSSIVLLRVSSIIIIIIIIIIIKKLSEKTLETTGSRKSHCNIRTTSMVTRYCKIQSSYFR